MDREQRIKRLCVPWLVLGLFYLGLAFTSLPVYVQRLTTLTIEPYHFGSLEALTNQAIIQAAAARGLTAPVYAVYQAVFNASVCLFCAGLAGLILWKARHQAFGWYTAAILLMLSSYPLIETVRQTRWLPSILLEGGSIFWPLYVLFFFVFPNGREAPGWARWPVGSLLLVHLFVQVFGLLAALFPSLEGAWAWFKYWGGASVTANILIILVCQVYRYRVMSTPLERQQTKAFLAGLVFQIVSTSLVDQFTHFPFLAEVNTLALMVVPLAVAISILRYRLWDIDLIIRRTLVYTLLTGLLGPVFFGGVTLLQRMFNTFTGQQSPASVVLSTLLIAALFNPLRRQVQSFIDRRFYRRKYDADLALATFSIIARREVEQDALTGKLLNIVIETVQPETVSLRVRKDGIR